MTEGQGNGVLTLLAMLLVSAGVSILSLSLAAESIRKEVDSIASEVRELREQLKCLPKGMP